VSPRAVWGSRFVLLAIASGTLLLAISMRVYPGGTALDARAQGHSFWLNFLCDLTEPLARNGDANPVGSAIARTAMLDLSLALGAFWLVLPVLFPAQPRTGRAIRLTGTFAVAALVAVPFTSGRAHAVVIFSSALAALAAGALTLVAQVRGAGPWYRGGALMVLLALTTLDSVFYARSVATSPRVVGPELPIFQRLSCLLALLWMSAGAVRILKRASAGAGADASRSQRAGR
jgi:hypothetical protein